MKKIRLILASQSPRRLEILRQIGFQPEVIVSGIEEHTEETIPERVVMDLSRQKAGNVAARLAASLVPVNDLAGRKSRTKAASDRETSGLETADSRQEPAVVVLGADTVVCTGGRILGKPHSHEEAEEMIRLLQGRTHQVCSGVTLDPRLCVQRGADGQGRRIWHSGIFRPLYRRHPGRLHECGRPPGRRCLPEPEAIVQGGTALIRGTDQHFVYFRI